MKTPVEMLDLLERAKRGDLAARDKVSLYVWERFGRRAVRKFYSGDLADDIEDLEQIFHLGVAETLPKLDHRGDPIFHLGMRGWWKVGAHVRGTRAKYRERSMEAQYGLEDEEGQTLRERLRDDTVDVENVVINQVGNEQQVEMIMDADLSPVARRAMEAILNDEAGDPTELGFNKRLAAALGVSQQRGTQAMQALRRSCIAEGIEA